MKIVHVFSAAQSAYHFMDKQFEFMHNKGCEIHVIIPNDNYFSKKFIEREKYVKTYFIPIKRKVSLFFDLISLLALFFLFKKIRADIIHLHNPKASLLGSIAARLLLHKKIIYQMHGLVSASGNTPKKNIVYYFEKATCKLATKIFAVSWSLRQFAIDNNYCAADKIEVIGNGTINGIDFECKFNPEKTGKNDKYIKKETIQNKFVIGFVGRINCDKGIKDYLEVFKYLINKIPILGIIVGTNESGKDFNSLLEHYNLSLNTENLLIYNHVFDPQNIMCHFDVLLFPTKREGFGLVAAEANSLKIPVVAYNIPGVKDAVENNVTGTLVEYGNIEALSTAVLEYYQNPLKKIHHGVNGRERIKILFSQKFLWNEIYTAYNKIYTN